jgi:hypothetical protein
MANCAAGSSGVGPGVKSLVFRIMVRVSFTVSLLFILPGRRASRFVSIMDRFRLRKNQQKYFEITIQ